MRAALPIKPILTALLLAAAAPAFAAEMPGEAKALLAPKPSVLEKYDKLLAKLKQAGPAPGGIICIGSSQMANWHTLATDLAPLSVHNHAVPGSRMADADGLFISNLAIPFKPRAVILYEGSNDLANDVTPEQILAQFQSLARKLHEALPAARLYVLGIVPSPGKRFEKIGELKRANALLQKECAAGGWMKFIDTTTPLLGADGQPRPECFIPGDIHMTPAGYALWKAAIAPVLLPAERGFETAPAGGSH